MPRVHLRIRGRVQGVFYRGSTVDAARGLGLTGWVRNRPDGSVEALAEGSEERLEQFVSWCRQGPPMAHVEDVEVATGEATGEFERFRVR